MKYDDYKWHIGNDFPKDLPEEAALTHIGIFIGWVIDKGFEGELLKEHFKDKLKLFKKREISGAKIIELCCDFKLVSEDLNNEANSFAKSYYETDEYFDDYADLSDEHNDTIFHEPDSWVKYDEVKNVIEEKYIQWKNKTE